MDMNEFAANWNRVGTREKFIFMGTVIVVILTFCYIANLIFGFPFGSIRSDAERDLKKYIMATGDGICESYEGASFSNVKIGTAVYKGTAHKPAITGAYSGTCVMHFNGDKVAHNQTYWFTLVYSNGNSWGAILLDNQSGIARNNQDLQFNYN